ncbi:helix-turn-helix domain-containing protein [Patescibacteria group bacterium]|nr:helix-turn-helix domain-containing protein [Patescibacteria group bacterium]MBU1457412.1 helix-turn-helix domain-containing protein [Patescibacteria group bacterium]
MKNKLIYTFEDDLKESLKDPGFKKAWQESETEYLLAKKIIDKRLKNKMSQRTLAKKLNTSQAAISRIETMQANPSLSFLKKIAQAFDSQLSIQFQ